MKCITIVVTLFAVSVATAKKDYYVTGNDHLDMDALTANPQMLKTFLDCYLDKAPCTELAQSYKNVIPEAVEQACALCNDNQKYMFWRFLEGVRMSYPEEYEEFKRHNDPENKYFTPLLKEISKYTKPSD